MKPKIVTEKPGKLVRHPEGYRINHLAVEIERVIARASKSTRARFGMVVIVAHNDESGQPMISKQWDVSRSTRTQVHCLVGGMERIKSKLLGMLDD